MADTFTPELNLTKVEINGSRDTWGVKLNANFDKIDANAAEVNAAVASYESRIATLETEAAKASFVNEVRMFSGLIADIANIPGGVWKLCDGTNGTPDMRNRFVMGAGEGSGYVNVGVAGGAAQWVGKVVSKALAGLRAVGHILTLGQMPYHQHGGTTDMQGGHDHDQNTGENANFGGGGNAGINNYRSYGLRGVKTSSVGPHQHNFATDWRGNNEAHDHALPDLSHDHDVTVPTLPPYVALAFIKRVA